MGIIPPTPPPPYHFPCPCVVVVTHRHRFFRRGGKNFLSCVYGSKIGEVMSLAAIAWVKGVVAKRGGGGG